ncbi:sigma-54-dependent Fis family transcriptional regulator [candidate division KSB1 bacterium]|nr:sigma-54-dependent Fis family transcriptional regulator [candidate division KSB1 bacterium]
MAKERILVVDDETSIGEFLTLILTKEGYRVQALTSPVAALARLDEEPFDLVITDLRMPEMSGIELVREVKQRSPEIGAIVITAFASLESAVEAMRTGAADYITKPFHVDEIRTVVEKVLDGQLLKRENRKLKARLVAEGASPARLIGSSVESQRLLELIRRVAPSDSTILITGESGTGKEVVAQVIHAHSERANADFVTVNCAALPDTLLESELFGHMRGSFTGAVRDKDGLFKMAHGGTLFLDEIGDMTPNLQVKLLRALQEREILPVGATRPLKIDVRVIAATNSDLERKQRTGEFRSDLFYRLSVIPIHIRPLRERPADIEELIDHFTERSCRRHNVELKQLTPESRSLLRSYGWPGNVRELENTIERAVILCETNTVDTSSLPGKISSGAAPSAAAPSSPLAGTLEDVERDYMLRVLETTGWQKKRASEILGIDPSTIYRKLQRYGIDAPK